MARSFLHLVCTSFVLWAYLLEVISAIKITGATGGIDLATGQRPSRQEINAFAASGAPYYLFILALRQLQSTNQTDPLSYFQIAGIHGYPEVPWDGVVGTPDPPWVGYCTHGAVVFPTWHRPYMALYEVRSLSRKFVSASTDNPPSSKPYGTMPNLLRVTTRPPYRMNT